MSQTNTIEKPEEKPDAGVMAEKIKEVASGLFEMESTMLEVSNLAMAVRMMASSDDMESEPGAAFDALADTIIEKLNALSEDRHRLWKLAYVSPRV